MQKMSSSGFCARGSNLVRACSHVLFFSLTALVLGCQSAPRPVSANKPMPAAKTVQKNSNAQSGLQRILTQLDKEHLREIEIDEAFLYAESLVAEKQFETAERLYKAVFDVSPNLVAGLKLARIKTLTGDTNEAENISRKLALLFPKSPEPLLALAYLAQVRGGKNESLEILAAAYKKHVANEEIAARYVEQLLDLNKKDKAKATLHESLKRMPSSPYFLLKLARLKSEDKNYKEAKNLLDRLLRFSPDSIEGWTLAGFIANEEKNYDAAERYFREAYEKQPENDTLARYYVAQLLRQDKYQEARRLLVKLESSAEPDSPLDPELTFQLGYIFFQLEEFAEAKTRFLSLAEKASDAGRMYYYAGQCDELRKSYKDARGFYDKIPNSSEFYQQGLQRIIFMTLDSGNFNETRSLLATYTLRSEDGEGTYRFVANVYARLNEYKKSIEIVKEGLKAFPKSADLAYLSAAYLEFTVSKTASLVALEQFILIHPKFATALNHLGYSLTESGVRLDFAAQLLKRAVAVEPKNGFYLDSLGWIYYKQKKLDDAERALLLALQFEPEEPVILEHLGEVKHARKQFPLALKYFERADGLFKTKPAWRVDTDTEWKQSADRVRRRITELRKMALPSDPEALIAPSGTSEAAVQYDTLKNLGNHSIPVPGSQKTPPLPLPSAPVQQPKVQSEVTP